MNIYDNKTYTQGLIGSLKKLLSFKIPAQQIAKIVLLPVQISTNFIQLTIYILHD